MMIRIASLALVYASVAADPCTELGDTLGCSACKIFIEKVFDEAARAPSALVKEGSSTKNLWHDGASKSKGPKPPSVAKVYTQRIKEVYRDHAPDKIAGVNDLLKKSKGKEHALYLRICAKYGVEGKDKFDGKPPPAAQDETTMWKFPVAEEAMSAALASADDGSTQWAKSGKAGEENYVDFNKAMEGGNMENLSMGGTVGEEMKSCFDYLAEENEDAIVTAITTSAKPFSSGLHKTLCPELGICKSSKKKSSEL